MLFFNVIIALIALSIATYTDIRTREVPDYISYGLIFISVASTLIYSLINSDYSILVQSVFGLIIGLGIAYAMFYLGQWGGGDSKLIIGLGAVIGFNAFPLFGPSNYWLGVLLIGIIMFGSVYGMVWSIILAIIKRKKFLDSLGRIMHKRKILLSRRIIMVFAIALMLIVLLFVPVEYKLVLAGLIAILYVMFYMWLFVRAIEESCMIKSVPVGSLTEGDWIYEDVYIGKRLITGPRDLGISREQIVLLKKYSLRGKIKEVKIKEGIPFIPAFLAAFLAMIIVYYFVL